MNLNTNFEELLPTVHETSMSDSEAASRIRFSHTRWDWLAGFAFSVLIVANPALLMPFDKINTF
jgi:hypothetical protein